MSPLVRKLISPLKAVLSRPTPIEEVISSPPGAQPETRFPAGYHVYAITSGPAGGKQLLVGAGDPLTAQGALFLGDGEGAWKQIDLPEETALLSHFLRLSDGRYLAGGMSGIGRGTLLMSDPSASEWFPVDLDLHPYCAIASLLALSDGSILVSTGEMKTQGKTRPVLFRSTDGGITWSKEEHDLPISLFQSFEVGEDGTLFGGTSGDSQPLLYASSDQGKTWKETPRFPAYKTYKMLWLKRMEGRLYVLLWGYNTEIADRVVRFYRSQVDFGGWEELSPVDDSHFIFSVGLTRGGTLYAGSEKGRVYRSEDLARSWQPVTQFPTNIGAYAIHEDPAGRIWVGKDSVPPYQFSLWRLTPGG